MKSDSCKLLVPPALVPSRRIEVHVFISRWFINVLFSLTTTTQLIMSSFQQKLRTLTGALSNGSSAFHEKLKPFLH